MYPEGAPSPLPAPPAATAGTPSSTSRQEHLSPPPLWASIKCLLWCRHCSHILNVSALTIPHHKQFNENHSHFHLTGKSNWGRERLVSKFPELKTNNGPTPGTVHTSPTILPTVSCCLVTYPTVTTLDHCISRAMSYLLWIAWRACHSDSKVIVNHLWDE